MFIKPCHILFASFALLPMAACTPIGVATGAGATVGVAAVQEGGVGRAVDDARIQIAINDLWFKYDFDTFRKLDLTINQGRVLITGVVQDPEHRVEAVRLAWQPEGVKQVINEIRVADSEGIVGFAKDAIITTRLRTSLTFNKEVLSINYSIDTVQGTVYLMGFAQSREELNRVIEIARTTSGVNGVVSYVRIARGDGDLSEGPAEDVTYQSTYDDTPVYQNSDGTPYYPDQGQAQYSTTSGYQGAGVEAVEAEPIGEPIVIRGNDSIPTTQYQQPAQPQTGTQSQTPSSESILWDDQ